ncbi:MAG: DUF89 family protein [Candidatus Aegiribacteria sp.]|nr:DUF89 family protein [Candidatus Aegiribacteria sp.]
MKAELACLPCLVRMAIEAAERATDDSVLRKSILRRCLAFMSETDFDKTPPELAQGITSIVSSMTGVEDFYQETKAAHTKKALHLIPEMEKIISESKDPFIAGLRLAIAGNIIDLGVKNVISEEEIMHTLVEAMSKPLSGVDPEQFRREVFDAERILYLADNAGETVFDRIFIEQLPRGKVTVAVRGAPAINDATLRDAVDAGLDQVAKIVENGSGAPATVLRDCSPEFREIFRQADLIISKGQGNFESLSSVKANIYFLFRVKCDLVEEHTGFPVGSLVLMKAAEDE